jgi:phosphomevalonate kinase
MFYFCLFQATKMIQELVKCNALVEDLFFEIHLLANDLPNYLSHLRECALVPANKVLKRRDFSYAFQWKEFNNPVAATFVKLREAFLQVRFYLRLIGEKADVDIEPPSQQELTDATMDLPGVLISGVPGGNLFDLMVFNGNKAGGYDAVFAIVLNEEVLKTIENIWMTRSTLPLILKEESKGVCLDTSPELSKL